MIMDVVSRGAASGMLSDESCSDRALTLKGYSVSPLGRETRLHRQRHGPAIQPYENGLDKIPGQIGTIALQGRDLFLTQACHRSRHTDDGAKLMLVLAFSRALQARHLPSDLSNMLVLQLGQVLKFPELPQLLNRVDGLGQSLVTAIQQNGLRRPSDLPEIHESDLVTGDPGKIEFVDDPIENYRILYTTPAKIPVGPFKTHRSFDMEHLQS